MFTEVCLIYNVLITAAQQYTHVCILFHCFYHRMVNIVPSAMQ